MAAERENNINSGNGGITSPNMIGGSVMKNIGGGNKRSGGH